jgi:hypothetical protein
VGDVEIFEYWLFNNPKWWRLALNYKFFDIFVDLFPKIKRIFSFGYHNIYLDRTFLYNMPFTTCRNYEYCPKKSKMIDFISLIVCGIAQTECQQMTWQHLHDTAKHTFVEQLQFRDKNIFPLFPYTNLTRNMPRCENLNHTIYEIIKLLYLDCQCNSLVKNDRFVLIVELRYSMILQIISNSILIPLTYETKHLSVVDTIINESLDKILDDDVLNAVKCSDAAVPNVKCSDAAVPNVKCSDEQFKQIFDERHIAIKNILSDAFSANNIAEKMAKWCRYCATFHKENFVNEQPQCKMTFARFLITHHLYDPRILLQVMSFIDIESDANKTYCEMSKSDILKEIKRAEFYYAASKLIA